MPTSPSGVNYEWAAGPSEEFGPTAQTLALTATCAWSDRFKLGQDLLGWSLVDPGSQVLRRVLPMPHPESGALWATGVRLASTLGVVQEVFGAPAYRLWQGGSLARDGKAYLAVTYQSTPYDVKADGSVNGEWERFTVRRLRRSVEAQRIIGGTWRFVGTGPPSGVAEKVLRADMNLPYTLTAVEWHWLALPATPPNMLYCTNRINATDFQEFAAGTLLFSPPQEEPVQLPNLARGYNVTFAAVHRPNGWNKVFRSVDPTGANRGVGFYAVEAATADAGGVRRLPFLSYEFRNCWSFVPDGAVAAGF